MLLLQELKLWNGSLSYSYWHKPGVIRLTKVYIFNVTNPQAFLEHGEKPKLVEVGPFVYRYVVLLLFLSRFYISLPACLFVCNRLLKRLDFEKIKLKENML